MTDDTCTQLSDRIPEVARGRSEWSTPEAEHLASCTACAAEWHLARAAQALARRGESLIVPDHVATGVVRRLRESPAGRVVRRLRWAGVAVAAAAAMLLFVRTVSGPDSEPVAAVASAPAPALFLPGLDSLSIDELETVLSSIDQPIEAVSTIDAPEWGVLDDHELELLLREWEG